jgi:hypothetical protein
MVKGRISSMTFIIIGTVSMALAEVTAGDAQTPFDSTQKLLEDMAAMLVDSGISNGTKDDNLRQLLVRLQNVMTDRHVVNKLWVKHMQSWREEVFLIFPACVRYR